MKKTILLSVMVLVMCTIQINKAKGQMTGGVSIGTLGIKEFYFYGINLCGKYAINEKLRAGANIGYYSLIFISVTPITGLIEYSFNERDISPYAGIELGLYRLGIFVTQGQFTYGGAAVGGVDFHVSRKTAINVNAKYNMIMVEGKQFGGIGVNAGLVFNF